MASSTVRVNIVANTQGFSKGIGDADTQLSKFGGNTKKILAGLGTAFAGLQIGKFLAGTITQAEESQKIARVTDQLVKQTGASAWTSGEAIGGLATKLSNLTGVDDEVIQSGENVLLTFKNVQDQVGAGNDIFTRASGAALDLSAVLGTDLSSANTMLGKALNDPIKGVTALSKAGVQFTDSQKDQIKTLVESGDVLGAQKIIMGEVESQVGDAAAANATASEKMKVAWGNFQEEIGARLLPVFDTLVGYVQDILPAAVVIMDDAIDGAIDAFKTLHDWGEKNTDVIAGVAASATTAAIAFGVLKAVNVASAFFKVTDGVSQFSKIMGFATNPVFLVIAAIAILIGALVWAYFHFDGFRAVVDKVVDVIQNGLAVALQWVTDNVIPVFIAAWQWIVDTLWPKIITGFETARDVIVKAFGVIVDAAVWLWEAHVNAFNMIRDGISTVVDFFTGTVLPIFQTVWGAITDVVGAAANWFMEHVAPVIGSFVGMVVAFFQLLWGGVKLYFGIIGAVISNFIDNFVKPMATIIGVIVGVVIAVFQWLWDTVSPILSGIGSVVGTVVSTIWTIFSTFIGWLSPVWATLWGVIQEIVSGVFGGIKIVVETALGALKGIFDFFTALFKGNWSDAWTAIQTTVSTVMDGISAFISRAFDAIKGVFSTVWNGITAVFTNVWNGLSGIVSGGINAVIGTITSIPGRIFGVLGSIGSAAASIGSSIASGISNGIANVFTAAGDIASKVWRGIAGFINDNVVDKINNFSVDVPIIGHVDFPNLPRLAMGTSGFAGGMAMVGERGPETVYMPPGSRVVPNHLGGGDGNSVNVNVYGSNLTGDDIAHAVNWELAFSGR